MVSRVVLVLVLLTGAVEARDTAEFRVTFHAHWSATLHPLMFPPNPHFSDLVGATHDDSVTFWEQGALASPGMEAMAEQGTVGALEGEVDAAIATGSADQILDGTFIAISPGSTQLEFTVDSDFPLVTLVSMLAPSPDWFVGVSGLPLHDGSDWINWTEVSLYTYDAGTDSGTTYIAINDDTDPPAPIALLDEPHLNPGTYRVGRFVFVRLDGPPRFTRGDLNHDNTVSIADAVTGLDALFGAIPISCASSGDLNDDGQFNIADVINLLNGLFASGPPIPAPNECGPDPTPDALGCESSPSCP